MEKKINLLQKIIVDITEGAELHFDELKRKHDALMQLYGKEEQLLFIQNEIEKLRISISQTNMVISPNSVLNNLNRGLEHYFYLGLYGQIEGLMYDVGIKRGKCAIHGPTRSLMVRPEESILNEVAFDFSTLEREKALVQYIAQIRLLDYLKRIYDKPPAVCSEIPKKLLSDIYKTFNKKYLGYDSEEEFISCIHNDKPLKYLIEGVVTNFQYLFNMILIKLQDAGFEINKQAVYRKIFNLKKGKNRTTHNGKVKEVDVFLTSFNAKKYT